MPGWDNQARKPWAGHAFHNADPESYLRWLLGALKHAEAKHPKGQGLAKITWGCYTRKVRSAKPGCVPTRACRSDQTYPPDDGEKDLTKETDVIKRDELHHPNSCLNKAKDDELVFVLLERDPAIVSTVLHWINTRIQMGKNKHDDPQITEAFEFCNRVLTNRIKKTRGE